MSTGDKKQVREFWNRNVNQFNQLQRADVGTREFYDAAETLRYKYHYHLLPLFDRLAREYPNGKLLEVGCSMGNDTIQLARRGFQVTGVDLTERAIELIKQRFALYNIQGEFREADAEALPFADQTFDVAYSFGVLHHTPNTAQSIAELHRVLKPGGKAVVMLYNRNSLNWLAHRVTGVPFDGSKKDPCPIEKTYTPKAATSLFAPFRDVSLQIEYLFGTGWGAVNLLVPQWAHRSLGHLFGWHLMIEAIK